jgi:hypothetical protein
MNKPDAEPEVITIRDEHLRFVRSLRVTWCWAEAGAPQLGLIEEGGSEEQLLARVQELMGPLLLSDRATLVALCREGMLAAEAFVARAVLAPGVYEFDSPLSPEVLASQPFVRSGQVEVRGGRVRIEVTPTLLTLIGRAGVRFFDNGGADCFTAIDPKRPYGNYNLYELEMAEILDIKPEGRPREDAPGLRELTDEQVGWLQELHELTAPALQVLLLHGELGPRRFRREPAGYGRWTRV